MRWVDRLKSREFNGYLARRIPHELDEVVGKVVADYLAAAPAARRDLLADLTRPTSDLLSIYGRRMATVAVRRQSVDTLRRGLVAIGVALGSVEDGRMSLIDLAAVSHAAGLLGTSLEDLIRTGAPDVPAAAVTTLEAFTNHNEAARNLSVMGLRTVGTGEDFRYV